MWPSILLAAAWLVGFSRLQRDLTQEKVGICQNKLAGHAWLHSAEYFCSIRKSYPHVHISQVISEGTEIHWDTFLPCKHLKRVWACTTRLFQVKYGKVTSCDLPVMGGTKTVEAISAGCRQGGGVAIPHQAPPVRAPYTTHTLAKKSWNCGGNSSPRHWNAHEVWNINRFTFRPSRTLQLVPMRPWRSHVPKVALAFFGPDYFG